MKLWKSLFSMALCLVLVLTPVTVNAAADKDGTISFGDLIAALSSGSCGENLKWSVHKNGTLTISGTGPMKPYSSGPSVPWHAKSGSVKKVILEAGVTSISDYAFAGCANLEEVRYGGTKAQWDQLTIGSNNDPLLRATLYCAEAPTGDVDSNGALTTDDAVYLLLRIMFGAADYPVSADTNLDVDGDSTLTTDDAVYLLLHIMFGATDYPLTP